MKRKNHNAGHRITSWRLPAEVSNNLPELLLRSFLSLPELVNHRGEIYDIIKDGINPTSSSRLIDYCQKAREELETISDLRAYRAVYQVEVLLKKYPFPSAANARRSSAIDKFYEAENICAATNRSLRNYSFNDKFSRILYTARGIIDRILGPRNISACLDMAAPGPGMTNSPESANSETTLFFKYSRKVYATPSARYLTQGLISRDPHWFDTHKLRFEAGYRPFGETTLQYEQRVLANTVPTVEGNRITFVPKDAKTDRTIAIEPCGNVMLQLGVGRYIKHRLRPWGINLFDQTKNQRMARSGSIDGSFATIDLSMASDTLSYETVKSLLPTDWFALLDTLRSPTGSLKVDGKTVTVNYEKFSSMGNGYTFELESLIFFAISLATMRCSGFEGNHTSDISVFGDDLVVPSVHAKDIIDTLCFFGFKVNEEKSFTSGPFRESCGKDYFLGVDVRPFFLKRKIRTIKDLHFVANSLAYKCISHESVMWWPAYDVIFGSIPNDFLIPGPLHFSHRNTDYGLELDHDDLESCLRVPLSWAFDRGYYRLSRSTYAAVYRQLNVSPIYYDKKYDHSCYTLAGRYHTFLQGMRGGRIVLRGKTRDTVRIRSSSQWDGDLPRATYFHPLG